MLSKEEIEYIEQIEKALENNENFYWQEDMYELIEIIKKHHGKDQNLIEKLEEDKDKHYDTCMGCYASILLEIAKGVEV